MLDCPVDDDDDPEYDPFVVQSLVMRYPVAGASRRELEAAAVILHDRGFSKEEAAAILRTDLRLVDNAVGLRNKRARRHRRRSA